MCGRYAYILPPEAMVALFRTLNEVLYPPRYNIAPTQPIIAIWEQQGRRTAQLVRWGLVPAWVKDPKTFPLVINARAETMGEKPAFRGALKNERCIIPASGYFEWMTGKDGRKRPYYITLADGRPMALAGLYSTWSGPEGEEVDTAAIVTVASSVDLASIHDRMPAILASTEAVDTWLNTRDAGAHEARQFALPLPPGATKFHPVSPRLGSGKLDDPSLIEPVTLEPPEPPAPRKKAAGGGQMDLF